MKAVACLTEQKKTGPRNSPVLSSLFFGKAKLLESPSADESSGPAQRDALAERLVEEMKEAWQQGQRPVAEDFLNRYPELASDVQAAVRLIYEEICLRQQWGLEVASAQFVKRFPQWQAELKFLLDCHGIIQPMMTGPVFPSAGQTWTDFLLLAELGRGTFGRVFLAKQHSLSDRPVVLKMMAADEGEHLSLARLQHTHIVPLYAVQEDPARSIRALCMPYFGGASLDRILEALKDKPVGERTGQDILRALDELQAASPVSLPSKGPARYLLARASYVQALCWIGSCLAEALHYAHDRGLVHLDLKPHNVLLASDGQAMLLDFNLAREPLQPGAVTVASFGGTPEYMSPEQELALARMRAHLPISLAVDARSDIYSLGLVLYQALGGTLASKHPLPYLHTCNPQVSFGLADLIHKCLAQDASDRYPDAATLAADLRRLLADLPLRAVANRSLFERWRKWRRRQPHLLVEMGLLLTLLLAAAIAGFYAWGNTTQQLHEAETALTDGQAQLQSRAYAAALRSLNRGIALAEGLPRSRPLLARLVGQLSLAQRAVAAHQLHLITEGIRFLYGKEPLDARQAAAVEAECRRVWDTRDRLTRSSAGALEPELEEQIQHDLLDLVILWADLHVRLTPANRTDEARQDALRLLGEAEARLGSSIVLARECQEHWAALGRRDLAEAAARRIAGLSPRTAWEHYSLGRFLLRSGQPAQAMRELERALELRPQDFWSNFYQGACAFRLGRYDDALRAYRVCVALAPDCAECFYNRGLAEAALGHTERALYDYNRALQLTPGLAAAALSRGILHYQAKRYQEALADFRWALDQGGDGATVHYHTALVYASRKERGAALESLRRVFAHDGRHKEARELYDRLCRER